MVAGGLLFDTPTLDASGNLYGTTYLGGAYGNGSVFKLTPGPNGWSYTDLHDFTVFSDGANPSGSVTLDSQGNIYGTTTDGGNNNSGVVFEIMP